MEPHFIAKKLPKLPRPDPRFLCGRNTIIAFELVMLIAGIGPYDKQWFGDHPKCADGRMKMMRDFAQGITRNLFRDIDDRIIRPLVLGADEVTGERDRSLDAIGITEADTFARRLGSPHWAVLEAIRISPRELVSEDKQRYLAWARGGLAEYGSYPPQQPSGKSPERMCRRGWAHNNGVPRDTVEEWHTELEPVRRGRPPIK